jgi:hypothetical protein
MAVLFYPASYQVCNKIGTGIESLTCYSQSHELRLPWNKIIALDFLGLSGFEHGKLHILHWAELRLRALGKPRP